MSTFTKFRDAFEGFFSGPIWNFLKPIVVMVESEGGQILVTAAQDAVTAGFAVNGSGEVKMAAALASFSAEVVANGLPFIESQARLLIETALQKAKVSLPAAPVPAPAPAPQAA